MAPRCTPQERLIAPCPCALRDCLLDVGEAASAQRQIVVDLYNAKKIRLEEALQRFQVITFIEDAGYAECSAENARCRGAESLPHKPFTPQQKDQFRSSSKTDWRHGATRWIVRQAVKKVTNPLAPSKKYTGVFLSIAVFGTCILHAAQVLEDVANDPIDGNFHEMPEPVVIELPQLTVEDGLDEAQVASINAWLDTEAKGASFANAFATAINRAQGAQAAADLEARDRELAAARNFANQWADALGQAAGQRSIAALTLSNPTIEELTISQTALWEVQQEVVASGWPEELCNFLNLFQISDENQDRILRRATSTLNEITEIPGSLIDFLTDTEFTAREIEVRAVLKEFAMA